MPLNLKYLKQKPKLDSRDKLVGRIKRKAIDLSHGKVPQAQTLCPLCGRGIPIQQRDEHHLVPKSKGGKQTMVLHRICHRQIHALLTEKELAESYSTIDALLEHKALAHFVQWVKNKPNDFYLKTRKSQRLRQ